jgi:heptosyltransferase-3
MKVPVHAGRVLHQVENTYRLLSALGIEGPPPPLKLVPGQRLVEQYQRQIAVVRGSGRGPVVGVHISAREAERRWQDANFEHLITRLIREHQATVLLTWAPGQRDNPQFPGDDDSAKKITTACASEHLLALPTADLEQLIASLAVCDIVISSDGGPTHLAAALGKPVLCFFGKYPEQWHPWGVPYRLLRKPGGRVSEISLDEAMAAYRELAQALESAL